MKCLVCGTDHSDTRCPVCLFPVVAVPGDVSEQEVRQMLRSKIEEHRKKLLPNIKTGIVLYQYDVHADGTVTETSERVFFEGSGSSIRRQEPMWLNRKFDTVSDRDMVEAEIFAEISGYSPARSQSVRIPQIASSQEQNIGIRMDDELRFSICVRSETGTVRMSEWYPLFR